MPQTVSSGAPKGFRELQRFFPRASQLASALGASRETIRAWEERRPGRLRESSSRRVELLLATCREASTRLSDREAVGIWMLARQPSLDGESPARLIRVAGVTAYDKLLQAIYPEVSPPALKPRTKEFWNAFAEGLPEKTAERITKTQDAIERKPELARKRALL